MHTGKQVRINDAVGTPFDDRLLVAFVGIGFGGGDPGRSDISEIRAQRLRRQDRTSVRDRARQGHQPVEPFADFLHQRERAEDTCMAACARCHGDEAAGTLFDSLARKPVVDDVVHGNAAPAFDGAEHLFARAERGDDQGHLPFRAGRHVRFEPVVRLVHDLVHGVGRRRTIGIVAIMCGQFFGDLMQPFIDLGLRAGIERGERPDDPRLALRNDQFRTRYDEERRADDRQAQLVEGGGQGHGGRSSLV